MLLKLNKSNVSWPNCIVILVIVLLTSVLVACHEEGDIDFESPTITVDSPTPGSDVTSLSVLISGTVSSDVTLVKITVDTTTVTATLAGTSYSGNVTLLPGANTVTVKATDATGNSNALTFNLQYPQLALSDGAAATYVIGQADFVSNTANQGSTAAANTVSGLQAALHEYINTTLYLPDSGNNRILGFNTIPTASNASASFALGQGDFASTASGTSATQFTNPMGVYATSKQLFLADSGNNRVLIWNSHPTSNTVAASYVIGQVDFVSAGAGCSSSTLSAPSSVFVVSDKVLVLDQGNHRVLIWNSIPAADGVAADLVIGQQNLNSCQPNDTVGDNTTDGINASTLNNPGGLWTDGTRLLVADTDNNRVLVWDTFPTANGQAADWAIGQSDMTSSAAPAPPTASSLNLPRSVTSNKNQIIVADSGNTRVLIYNSFPASAGAIAADNVIGQSDFVTTGTGTTANMMTSYDNVFVDRIRLFVVDGNRVLVWENP